VLLLWYVLTGSRWAAFLGLLWAFHIAGVRILGYGLKFTSSFQDTHLGKIGKQRLSSATCRRSLSRRATPGDGISCNPSKRKPLPF